MNPEKILIFFLAFSTGIIPAILLLWFFSARKLNTKIFGVIIGFISACLLARFAGELNNLIQLKFKIGLDSPIFFLFVALNEEFVKFISSLIGIISAKFFYKKSFSEIFANNPMALGLSGALGFAGAENFIYVLNKEGSFTRFLPLFAHCFFALFWIAGLKLFLTKNNFKTKIISCFYFMFGILSHFIYNCVVSEEIDINIIYKILAFTFLLLAGFFALKINMPFSLKREIKNEIQKKENEIQKGWGAFFSFLMPGSAHFLKKEYFNAFIFFFISLITPILSFLIFQKAFFNLIKTNQLNIALIIIFTLYIIIGLWAFWESQQKNTDIIADRKKRFSIIFSISTLSLLIFMLSFFLPSDPKLTKKQKKTEKDKILKEIPMGLSWEIEEITLPQQKIKTDSESLNIENDKAKKIIKNKGTENSQNKNPLKSTELPKMGYIGIQLSSILYNGNMAPFVVFVYADTSAERAGLEAQDVILSVNGISTLGMDAFQASEIIRGPIGTSAKLEIFRKGDILTITTYRTSMVYDKN